MTVLMVFSARACTGAYDEIKKWRTDGNIQRRTALAVVIIVVAIPFMFASRIEENPFADQMRLGAANVQAGQLDQAVHTFTGIIVDADAMARRNQFDVSTREGVWVAGQVAMTTAVAHRALAK